MFEITYSYPNESRVLQRLVDLEELKELAKEFEKTEDVFHERKTLKITQEDEEEVQEMTALQLMSNKAMFTAVQVKTYQRWYNVSS